MRARERECGGNEEKNVSRENIWFGLGCLLLLLLFKCDCCSLLRLVIRLPHVHVCTAAAAEFKPYEFIAICQCSTIYISIYHWSVQTHTCIPSFSFSTFLDRASSFLLFFVCSLSHLTLYVCRRPQFHIQGS